MVRHFECQHGCLVKKNVTKQKNLPNRWQYLPESLGARSEAIYGKFGNDYNFRHSAIYTIKSLGRFFSLCALKHPR